MIRINLLPYRTQRRQLQILQHLIAAIAVISVAAVIVFVADMIKTSELTGLEDEFSNLQAQNRALKKRIGKIKDLDRLRADVEKKLQTVKKLQEGRFNTFETLRNLALAIPENVWLTSFKENNGSITLNGLGESNKAVANFMRALDEDKIFSNIKLSKITRKTEKDIPIRSFILTFSRVVAAKPKEKAASRGRK